jgi:hypothetical protein
MSEGLRAYLITDERDIQVLGCRRRKLLDKVLAVRADRFAEYDEEGDIEQKGQIGHAEALRELFAGRLTRPDCGPIYGWAYELYCAYMGGMVTLEPILTVPLSLVFPVGQVSCWARRPTALR